MCAQPHLRELHAGRAQINDEPGVELWILRSSCGLIASLAALARTPQILMRDEEGIEADKALRRVLDGDSDCGSVYESITARDGEDAAVEGAKARAAPTQTQTTKTEPPQADNQAASTEKRWTQSTGGGATAQDRRSAGREGSARRSSAASVGDLAALMFADEAEPTNLDGLSVSVRAKIEMFERTARSIGGEGAKLKVAVGRAPQSRGLSRSLSEKVRAHESAISAATNSKGMPPGLGPSLSRSQSCQTPNRASPPPTVTPTSDVHVTENRVWPSRGS